MDMDKLREYVRLVRKKRSLKEQIEGLDIMIRDTEAVLVDMFKENGIQNVNVDGEIAHLRRDIRASAGGEMPKLIDALVEDGQDWLVTATVSAQTLAAWVREFQGKDRLSPEEIKAAMIVKGLPHAADAVTITEQWSIGVKKG